MNIKIIFCVVVFLGLCIKSQAQCSTTNVTLFVTINGVPNPQTNASYNVQSGQIAKIVYACVNGGNQSDGSGTLQVSLSNTFFTNASIILLVSTNNLSASSNLPVIAGPATISVTKSGNGFAICTIEVSTPNAASSSTFVPSTAVVIPSDSGGSVNIILESSSDLINW